MGFGNWFNKLEKKARNKFKSALHKVEHNKYINEVGKKAQALEEKIKEAGEHVKKDIILTEQTGQKILKGGGNLATSLGGLGNTIQNNFSLILIAGAVIGGLYLWQGKK